MADAEIDQASTATHYQGTNRLTVGIVLAVITFWLFAQTALNVAPAMRDDLGIGNSVSNIAVSIAALFSGILIDIGKRGNPGAGAMVALRAKRSLAH
jgi:MFS transporter, DHA2 family, multidrug resistance protein